MLSAHFADFSPILLVPFIAAEFIMSQGCFAGVSKWPVFILM
jgi:hypothetical protein